jgi:hypothetical protein
VDAKEVDAVAHLLCGVWVDDESPEKHLAGLGLVLAFKKDVEPVSDIRNQGGILGDGPDEVRHRCTQVSLDLVGARSKKQHVAIRWVIAVGTKGKV